jgi:hypothetical protein
MAIDSWRSYHNRRALARTSLVPAPQLNRWLRPEVARCCGASGERARFGMHQVFIKVLFCL